MLSRTVGVTSQLSLSCHRSANLWHNLEGYYFIIVNIKNVNETQSGILPMLLLKYTMNSILHCVCLIYFPVIAMLHWEYLNCGLSFISNSSCHVVHVTLASCGSLSLITVMFDDWHSQQFQTSSSAVPWTVFIWASVKT